MRGSVTIGVDDLKELRVVIEAMIAAHERWLVTIAGHRAAIAQGDPIASGRRTLEQQSVMGEIAELEARRQELFQLARLEQNATNREPMTITELAAHVPEPTRTALLDAGERLRALIERTQREQEVLRLAAGSLAAHMEGLVRQVASKLQRAATYSPKGRAQAAFSAGVDILQ